MFYLLTVANVNRLVQCTSNPRTQNSLFLPYRHSTAHTADRRQTIFCHNRPAGRPVNRPHAESSLVADVGPSNAHNRRDRSNVTDHGDHPVSLPNERAVKRGSRSPYIYRPAGPGRAGGPPAGPGSV